MPATMVPAAAALLLMLQLWSAEAQVAVGAGPPPGCPDSDRCGNVSVPYPFAISHGCSLPGFELTCDTTRNPPRLMIGNGTLQVVDISLANSTVRAMDLAGAVNITPDGFNAGNGTWSGLGAGGGIPYVVSERRNQLIVTGCNRQVTLSGDSDNVIIGCSSFCSINDIWTDFVASMPGNSGCSGIACCKTPIPIGRSSYRVLSKSLDAVQHEFDGKVPNEVRIAELGWFDGVAAELLNNSATDTTLQMPAPVVLDWALASTPIVMLQGSDANDANWSCLTDTARRTCRSTHSYCLNVTGNYRRGYVCECQGGYDGNPYVASGCQDINECERPQEYKCFGECTNTLGSFICRCPRGARGNATIPNGCTKSNIGNQIIEFMHRL